MAFILAPNTQETSTDPGTGDFDLDGAVTGFLAFSNGASPAGFFADGDETYYCAFQTGATPAVETGLGTFRTGPDRITDRTDGKVFKSTANDMRVNFSGTVNVLCGLPGEVLQSLLDDAAQVGFVKRTGSHVYTAVNPTSHGEGYLTLANEAAGRGHILAQLDVVAAEGSLVIGDAGGDASELVIAGAANYLRSDGSTAAWSQPPAAEVTYDDTDAPFTAPDVQDALDHLADVTSTGIADGTLFEGNIFYRMFESNLQTISDGGTFTVTHGLGQAPKLMQLWLQNNTTEFNWNPGDRILHGMWHPDSGDGSRESGCHLYINNGNTTQISCRYSNDVPVFQGLNKTTAAKVAFTNGNWRVFVRAYA